VEMHYSQWFKAKAAPIGAISLIAIAVTAMCFPVVRVVGRPGAVLIVFSYLLFSPAVVGAVYSIAAEKSKVFALAGLLVASVTVLLQRETLYFLAMGIFLVPGYAFAAMLVVIARRYTRSRRQAAQNPLLSNDSLPGRS
jgi:hypothetical protein